MNKSFATRIVCAKNRLPGTLYRYACPVVIALVLVACSPEPVELGVAQYPDEPSQDCINRDGGAGTHDEETSAGGVAYSVRTPQNYLGSTAHPLLVVYPGAGHSAARTERYTALTEPATAAGYVIAYVDHERLSLSVLDEFARIPAEVAQKWCIDTSRVFLTGHSDGGTAASAMAFRADDNFSPSAIAPSAAGMTAEDLGSYDCPEPLPVLVFHSADDTLFPGFGRSAASWWAACNGCNVGTGVSTDGCVDFPACPPSAPVRYCEGSGGHRTWPGRNEMLLNFFTRLTLPTK